MKESNKILVSIIIPVYNLELYIDKCIQSILSQTYHDLQIILVDDGSTDNSFNIMKKFAEEDDRIVLLSQKNSGVSSARNYGLQMASGEYIMFVDGDDTIVDNAVGKLLEFILKYDTDIVCCGFTFVNSDGNISRAIGNVKVHYVLRNENILANYLLGKNIWSSCCARLYKKKFLDKYRINFLQGLSIGEDGYFTLQVMSKASSIVIIGDCLYRILVRLSSATRSSRVEMRVDSTPELYADYLRENGLWKKFEFAYKGWYIRHGSSNLLRLAVKVPFRDYCIYWKKYMQQSEFRRYNKFLIRKHLGIRNHFISLIAKSAIVSFYFMNIATKMMKKNRLF